MKIVVATGGSGGHLFPALAVAEILRNKNHEVIFLGSFRDVGLETLRNREFRFYNLHARGFGRGSLKGLILSLAAMVKAILASHNYLREIKPDAVLGFGGYGAFPVVFAAVWLRVPRMIHEQNVIPGRANKILSRFVPQIAVSFKQSEDYFPKTKTVLTGCPCRISGMSFDRSSLLKKFGLEENRMTLLIFGGSQGSQRINQEMVNVISLLISKRHLQVIHLLGRQKDHHLRNSYEHLGIPFALFEFLDKMEEVYQISDLVIARAGASTVTEIGLMQKPAILIPYPFAGGHQKRNALVLQDVGLARVMEEKDLSAENLAEMIAEMMMSRQNPHEIHQRLKGLFFVDAAQRVVDEIFKLTGKKNDAPIL